MAAIRTRRGLFDVPQLARDVVQQALLIWAELFAEQGGPDICRKLILAARVHYRRGGILGLAISYGLSAGINALMAMQGAGGSFRSVIPPYLALGALVFSILVGVLAGLYPSQRAMRLSALAAIRNE